MLIVCAVWHLPEALCAAQMLAAKAYDLHNAELQGTGLTINTPETMWNVPLAEARPASLQGAQNQLLCSDISHTRPSTWTHARAPSF